MSVLVQRLGRLRGAYPALLRLNCDNHSHRVISALTKCSTPSATWINPGKTRVQRFTVTAVVVDSTVKDYVGPEKISENLHAHNLFLNSPKYNNTVMRPSIACAYVTNDEALKILDQDWSSMTSAETVSAVKKLSYNVRNSNERLEPLTYSKAFNSLNIQNLTNDDLIIVMQHLVPFNSHIQNYHYNNFFVQINKECVKRFLELRNINMILYICDIIYQMTSLNAQKDRFEYIWYSVRNLGNKPNKLNPQQLVQLLFFLNICRRPPINMYELEYHLEKCMDELSINELGIAALGFFKTSTKIKSTDFMLRILRRTINEIDVADTVTIASLIKLIRYSTTLAEVKIFLELLRVLTPYEPQYTLMTLTHIAQTCGRIAVFNSWFINRVIERLNKEIKTARLKEFERCLYTFSVLNIDSSNSVYENVVNELKATWNTTRANEIARFPQVVSRILGYLATQNIYPIDLIKYVMAPEYIIKTCNGNYHHISREYCVLDYSLRVEVPEYNGPFLKPNVCNFLEKKYYQYFLKTGREKSTRSNLLLTDVLATCQDLFKTTSDISVIRVLPHFTIQDIVFCINEQNQLVPSEKFFSQFESSDIKRVDKNSDNIRWIALVMGHQGLLLRNCSNTPTGALVAKIRQLSKIGYTPIMISQSLWMAHQSSQKKHDYIKRLVFRDNTSNLLNIT